jgi:DNA-binding MarR family transcriptional regulator
MSGGRPPPTVSRPALLDDGKTDRAFRRMVYDLMTVGARMQEVRDRLAAEMGVSGPQYAILMAIAHLQDEDGGAGVRAVARRLHVSGPFVTAQVNRLVDAGLVEKAPNPDDGRGVLLAIGAAGRAVIDRTAPSIRAANDTFFGNLDARDFDNLCRLAADLVESSEEALETFDDGEAQAAQ